MKNLFIINKKKWETLFVFIILTIITTSSSIAQGIPDGFNYQAIARNQQGQPIADKDIMVEVSIISDDNTEAAWEEIHTLKTNEKGFFSLIIGEGISTHSGSVDEFDQIKWDKGEYSVKVRVDFGTETYGNGLIDMGTAKLKSVPYSLISKRSLTADTALNVKNQTLSELIGIEENTIKIGQLIKWDGINWIVDSPGNMGTVSEVSGNYVSHDGSTNLSGDWTITDHSITIVNGSINSNAIVSENINTNNLSVANLLSGEKIYCDSIKTTAIILNNSLKVSNISSDITLDGVSSSNNTIPTQKAVKSYVDSNAVSYWNFNNNQIYNELNDIGIGTKFPSDKFHADIGYRGFLVTGAFDSGASSINSLGVGTRMAFYANKAAFRAGRIDAGTQFWDNDNIGNYSVAFGKDTKAFGHYSVAMGWSNEAIGDQAFVMGKNCFAYGVGSFVAGQDNKAYGRNSVTFGSLNTTNGEFSTALGLENETAVQAEAATVVGFQNFATGKYSLVFGNNSETKIYGQGALAGGGFTTAKGKYSVALGYNTTSSSFAEFVIGQFNSIYSVNEMRTWHPNDRLLVLGNGDDDSNRSDALVVWKNGDMNVNGNIIATGNVTWSSDKAYKRKIEDIDNALADMLKLQGVSYNWKYNKFPEKNFSKKRQFGFIAQDVEKLYPQIISTNHEGYKSVDYAKLTVILVEAVKEQQNKIEKLKTDNEILFEKLEEMKALKKTISELQNSVKKMEKDH